MLGDFGCGNRSLMHRFIRHKLDQRYRATIGADFLTKEIMIDNKKIIAQIWDTAGAQRFQSLGVAFYRGADACILIYDVSNQKSFEYIPKFMEEFECSCNNSNMDTFPYLLLANKCDLFETEKYKCQWNFIRDPILLTYGFCRNISKNLSMILPIEIIDICHQYFGRMTNGDQYAAQHDNILFYQTSAQNGENVHKAFDEIIRIASQRNKDLGNNWVCQLPDLSSNPAYHNQKTGCCGFL